MQEEKLHLVMIPWVAFGHMIPFLELAKCLAKSGHRVSFISTPRNIERLPSIPPNLSSHLLNLVPLTPPPIHGLPEHAQATSDISLDQHHLLRKLHDGLERPLCNFLRNQDPSPDWIIYDFGIDWPLRAARSFGLPCAFFGPFTAATLSFIGPPSVHLARAEQPDQNIMSPELLMSVPPWVTIPSSVYHRYHEAVQLIECGHKNPASGQPSIGTSLQGCDIVAVRTSPDFEPEWLHQLSQIYQKPVLPVGFLSPSPPTPLHNEEIGGENSIWKVIKWLDTQKHSSTVFVAFGSELRLTLEQVTELAFGLELSQLPFLWAYRGDPTLLPIGFQERIKDRGIVHMGWAPQPTFLAHPSVGAFLTHAGWGSTVEGLSFGKPLVMLPMIADQGLNARLMEEKKVGVEVCRNERDGSFTRDALAKALRLVTVEKEGEFIRANTRELQKTIGDKGRNDQYIDEFLQYLIKHRSEEKTPGE